MIAALRSRWSALGQRERLLTLAAALVASVVVLQFGYRAIGSAYDGLREDVAARREAVAIARKLMSAPAATAGHEPVLAVADRLARSAGLAGSLKRLNQDDDGHVRVRFEAASFATFARWLGAVQDASGARIESMLVARGSAPGSVDVTLSLVAP